MREKHDDESSVEQIDFKPIDFHNSAEHKPQELNEAKSDDKQSEDQMAMAQVSINEISFSEQVGDDAHSSEGASDHDQYSSNGRPNKQRINRNFLPVQQHRTLDDKREVQEKLHPAFLKRLNRASNQSNTS